MAASPLARRSVLAGLLALPTLRVLPAEAQTDPLPSWNDGPTKKAIIDFVTRVTREGNMGYVPPDARIAAFDNDGTLWCEQPVYTQLTFALDRVKALAPAHPEWRDKEPFKAVLDGDHKALAAAGEKGLMQIIAATHTGMSIDEFQASVRDWIATAQHPRFRRPYTECVYRPMLELHRDAGADVTVAVQPVPWEDASRFGVMSVNDAGLVVDFEEKPANPRSNLASMGVYVFRADVLHDVFRREEGGRTMIDFGHEVIPFLIGDDKVYAYEFKNYWRDVGTLDSYYDAHMDLCAVMPVFNLYNSEWPILTHIPPHPPAKFVHEDGDRVGRAVNSVVSNGVIRACRASSKATGGAFTNAASSLARRRACTAAGLSRSRAASDSSGIKLSIAALVAAGVGSGSIRSGLRVFCKKKFASSMSTSLAS